MSNSDGGTVSPESRRLISVVTPAYNEEGNVPELSSRLRRVFDANSAYDFEVIIVENGSVDATWGQIQAEAASDPRFKSLRLSRNFGADGGITAGLSVAKGDAVVTMCADLQDPPEMISPFIAKWEEGYDIVYGVVKQRQGVSLLRRFNSQAFYWLVNRMTDRSFPSNTGEFRLADRKVIDTVLSMNERNRFIRGLFYWSGFKAVGLEHDRTPRFAGESKANTAHVLSIAIRAILAYSTMPLRFITYVGLTVSLLSFVLLLWAVFGVVAFGAPFHGYGTLLTVMLLMFGFLFTMLGVVAEYVGLIYEEVKQRPNFVVRDKIGL